MVRALHKLFSRLNDDNFTVCNAKIRVFDKLISLKRLARLGVTGKQPNIVVLKRYVDKFFTLRKMRSRRTAE